MRNGYAPRLLGILALAFLAANQATGETPLTREQVNQIQRDCATISQCIEAMRTETAINFSAILEGKFESFGEAAVPALMEVLTNDPDARMRHYAGIALGRMPRIDARYLPALITASRQGDPQPFLDGGPGWIGIPIGLVRDNPDALRYLFDLAELYGAGASGNSVQPAIERSSREAWLAEARRRLEAFGPEQSAGFLYFLCQLGMNGGWPRPDPNAPPQWIEPALVRIATDQSLSAQVRATAEFQLRRFRNPIALAAIVRDARTQFAEMPIWDGVSRFVVMTDGSGEEEWERLSDGDIAGTIRAIGQFGLAARDAAPLLQPFLARADLPESRAEAALALGQIGDQGAIPRLIGALNNSDDWLLAYNASEALGRLLAHEALSSLTEVAAHHWSQAVRHNAERALNALGGGEFERPGVRQSGMPINDTRAGDDDYYWGPLRYSGDDIHVDAECLLDAEREMPFSQSRLEDLRFPVRGAVIIAPLDVNRTQWPDLNSNVRSHLPRGHVTAVARLAGGWLIGTNAGEFIGGLAYVSDRGGEVTLVVPDNVQMLWRQGGKIFALTGLSHLISSYGEVWEVDVGGESPRAVRRIRLPSEARSILATARGDVGLETREETFLLGRDGALRGGDDEATCEAGAR